MIKESDKQERTILALSMRKEEKEIIWAAAKRDGRTASGFIKHIVLNAIRNQNL